ncbi:MAG: oxidoreductase [Arachnia propionica]|nr:MAG: oxidoreductase [Arachnia propionica]
MQVGYAVTGVGYFGAELARILARQPGAKIVAVHDPQHAEQVARELGCDAEADLATMVSRDDVTALIIASPNDVHAEAALLAAQHGVHIFCEKPIALSYADCDQMVAAAEQAGVTFMAGHVMNFFSGVRRTKRLIDDGVIGEVLYAHSARNGWEAKQENVSWKKQRRHSGGHLFHHIHELDCIQFIMGPAQRNLDFGGDRFGLCEYGSAFRWPEHYVLFQGTKGAIKLDMEKSAMTLLLPDGEQRFGLHANPTEDEDRAASYHGRARDGAIRYGHPGEQPPLWLLSIMAEELQLFNALLHGEPVPTEFAALVDGSAARASIATADAAMASLQQRRWVEVVQPH